MKEIFVFDDLGKGHILSIDDKYIHTFREERVNIEMMTSTFVKHSFEWPLLNEIQLLLKHKHYLSALTMALLIPDICSSQDSTYQGRPDSERYSGWYDENINKYTFSESMPNNKFDCFNGFLCYVLRCQLTHGSNGVDAIAETINNNKSQIMKKYKNAYYTFTEGQASFTLTNKDTIIFIRSISQFIMQILCVGDAYFKEAEDKNKFLPCFSFTNGPIIDTECIGFIIGKK